MLDIAWEIAREAHAEQQDKAGLPYLSHPARVASLSLRAVTVEFPFLLDPPVSLDLTSVLTVALLHDVVEDTPWTLEGLSAAGVRPREREAVAALTHEDDEPYEDYIDRLAQSPLTLVVKYADLLDNLDLHRLSLLPDEQQERLLSRYEPALESVDGAIEWLRP